MEILIAMALTAIVTTSVLAIVRTQLLSFERNDQIVRTQQSARAAMDFVETIVRRACGGISAGQVGVNVPSLSPKLATCVNYVDGASVNTTSFATGGTNAPDALEVVYATGTMTGLTVVPTLTTSPLSVLVTDVTGFAADDYVLVSDYANADLFQISTVSTSVASGVRPAPGTITFKAAGGTLVGPTLNLQIGSPVFKAATYSFFVAPAGSGTYTGMLMIDSAGVASTNHLDFPTKVQPAVEGVVDFQIAVGADNDANGTIDQWIGSSSGGTLPATPWTTLRQVRVGIILQTSNLYAGTPTTLPMFEDRTSFGTLSNEYAPRYRSARMVVAPRAWNLAE
jgi:hypothetical protein